MKIKLFFILTAIVAILIAECKKESVNDTPPTISSLVINPLAPGATDDVTVTATVTDQKGVSKVNLFYKIGTGNLTSITMTAGTGGKFTAKILSQPKGTVISYYVQATNVSALNTVYPQTAPSGTLSYTVGDPAIVINEIFSRGVVTAPDWIELYNRSTNAIDISGYKIYDIGGQSGTKPKMTLPAGTTIAANGFYTIVVDIPNSTDPSGFGLSNTGEEVWLESAAGFVIDDVVFPAITSATNSYGRKPDGADTWQILTTVTKNAPNTATAPTITNLVINPVSPKPTDAVSVSATATDVQGISSVQLFYKVGSGSYITVSMIASGSTYSGIIPAQVASSIVSYYVEVTNIFNIISYSPVTAPTVAATYNVATPPAIANMTMNPTIPVATDQVVVSATVTDALSLMSVKLYYKVGSTSYTSISMTANANVYSATIPSQAATNIISYYIEAVNSLGLTTYSPSTAPATPSTYSVSSLSSISNMTISPAHPTASDVVTVSANIVDLQGINVAKLFYKIGAGIYTSINMTANGTLYSANIPAQLSGTVVSYYIEVTNTPNLKTYEPATAPAIPATFGVAVSPAISAVSILPLTPTAWDDVTLTATVDNLVNGGTVNLNYTIGTGNMISIAMTAAGNVYSAKIPAQIATSVISYYVEAANSSSLITDYPQGAPTNTLNFTVANSPVVLNEVCGLQSPDEDWVEIYNSSTATIDLTGMKIIKTDETGAVSTIYTAPTGLTIASNFYLVLRRTTTIPPEGALTAGISNTKNIKLQIMSAANVLQSQFEKTATSPNVAGHVSGGSYARIPDATGNWTVVATFTKGAKNQ